MLALDTLIKALGGPTAVAKALGLRPSAVTNWCRRGAMAAEHHIAIWRMAADAGIDWTPPGAAGLRLAPRDGHGHSVAADEAVR